jgi:hypothetical protein
MLNSDLYKIRLAPDLPERDFCVRRGVSLPVYDSLQHGQPTFFLEVGRAKSHYCYCGLVRKPYVEKSR